jgi:hypothetical protein
MPTPFKKKRRQAAGPNKNEMKVMRGKLTRSAGALKDVYPSVQSLTVELEFFTPQQHSLDRQTRLFHPSDLCNFLVPCPGRCGRGSFDLSAKLKSVIENRETRSESRGVCAESLFDGSKEPCGIELRCLIKTVFNA